MSSAANYVTADTLRGTGIAMLVIATLFMAARCLARWYRGWRFQIEDFFMFLAYAFFLSMTISYLVIIPPLYRITDVSEGIIPPYPSVLEDSLSIIKVFFTNSMLLWFTLWSVKFSVLFLYRRLMIGLPMYLRWWWAVLGFCVVVGPFPTWLFLQFKVLISIIDPDRCGRFQLHILQQHARLVYSRCVFSTSILKLPPLHLASC